MASGSHSINPKPHKGVWPDLLPRPRRRRISVDLILRRIIWRRSRRLAFQAAVEFYWRRRRWIFLSVIQRRPTLTRLVRFCRLICSYFMI